MLTHELLTVMIIPFTLLWDVRIHLPKKLAFTGLFSLTVITIAAAIARAIQTKVTEKANGSQDPSHVWMWGTIQASVGKYQDVTPKHAQSLISQKKLLLSRAFRPSRNYSLHPLAGSSPSGHRRRHTISGCDLALPGGTQGRRIQCMMSRRSSSMTVARRRSCRLLPSKVSSLCWDRKRVAQPLNVRRP